MAAKFRYLLNEPGETGTSAKELWAGVRHAGLSHWDAGVTTHTDSNKDVAQTTTFLHFLSSCQSTSPLTVRSVYTGAKSVHTFYSIMKINAFYRSQVFLLFSTFKRMVLRCFKSDWPSDTWQINVRFRPALYHHKSRFVFVIQAMWVGGQFNQCSWVKLLSIGLRLCISTQKEACKL